MFLPSDICEELSTEILKLENAIFKKGYEKVLSSIIFSFTEQNKALENFKKCVEKAIDKTEQCLRNCLKVYHQIYLI